MKGKTKLKPDPSRSGKMLTQQQEFNTSFTADMTKWPTMENHLMHRGQSSKNNTYFHKNGAVEPFVLIPISSSCTTLNYSVCIFNLVEHWTRSWPLDQLYHFTTRALLYTEYPLRKKRNWSWVCVCACVRNIQCCAVHTRVQRDRKWWGPVPL